jgi:hypothetical protein
MIGTHEPRVHQDRGATGRGHGDRPVTTGESGPGIYGTENPNTPTTCTNTTIRPPRAPPASGIAQR